jgi:D-alanyl-D-alanine carboxypeptidase
VDDAEIAMNCVVRRIATGVGLGIVGGAVLMPALWGAGRPAAAQAVARIDRLLSEAYPPSEPGAAALVSRNGTVVFEKGYGLADTARQVPVTPSTVFRLASVTKAFTGTAILMLADRGALALDDPVAKFLPAFPAPGRAVTVRQLLSHTSGLTDYLDRPNSMEWAKSEYTVQALIDAVKDRPPAFAPGGKSAYSNSNYVLLGAIIEKVSGLTFGRFLETSVFSPLGMKSTSCGGALSDVPGLATAYEPARGTDDQLDWSRLLVARPYTLSALYAAGGCVSSVQDLRRFHDALLGGAIVGRASLASSLRPAVLADGRPGAMSDGGWQLDRVDGRLAAMRGGALPGVCTWFLTMPEEEIAVILLSNRSPGKPRCGMLAVQVAALALVK